MFDVCEASVELGRVGSGAVEGGHGSAVDNTMQKQD